MKNPITSSWQHLSFLDSNVIGIPICKHFKASGVVPSFSRQKVSGVILGKFGQHWYWKIFGDASKNAHYFSHHGPN